MQRQGATREREADAVRVDARELGDPVKALRTLEDDEVHVYDLRADELLAYSVENIAPGITAALLEVVEPLPEEDPTAIEGCPCCSDFEYAVAERGPVLHTCTFRDDIPCDGCATEVDADGHADITCNGCGAVGPLCPCDFLNEECRRVYVDIGAIDDCEREWFLDPGVGSRMVSYPRDPVRMTIIVSGARVLESLDRVCPACLAATSQETWDLLHSEHPCTTRSVP